MLKKIANKQQTINNQVTIKGIGLHTGVKTTATFKPAEENTEAEETEKELEDTNREIARIKEYKNFFYRTHDYF